MGKKIEVATAISRLEGLGLFVYQSQDALSVKKRNADFYQVDVVSGKVDLTELRKIPGWINKGK